MTHDELEFAISQYLDGTLAEAEESALVSRLAVDPDARALLSEYRGVDRALRAAPVPAVDFETLAGRISDAVALQDEPAQSYRLRWVRTVAGLALAACVVIAAGVGIRLLQTQTQSLTGQGSIAGIPTGPGVAPKQIVVVDAMARAVASTAPVNIESIGPAASSPDRPTFARYDEDLLSRPSQVIIARSGYAAQDGATQDGPLLP